MIKTQNQVRGYAVARLGDTQAAVAVCSVGGDRWRVERRHHRASGALPPAWLRDLKRAGDQVGWLLSEDDVTCAMTPLPRLRRRELSRACSGWVARKEGGQPADWIVSWRQLAAGRTPDGRQNVYLAYAPREVISRHLNNAASLQIRPGLLLPPSLVLDQLFRRAGPDRESLKLWNLVFIGERTSIICVADRECLLLSRTLPRDLEAAIDDGEYLDRLVTEVDRSVFFARQTEGAAGVDRVVICGDPALAPRLAERLAEASGLTAVHWPLTEVIDPAGTTPTVDEQLLLAAAALAATGADYNLALIGGRRWLNPERRRRLTIAAGAAAVALVPILTVGALVTARVQDRYLSDARQRLVSATERAEAAAIIYERQHLLRAREQHLERFSTDRPDLAAALINLAAITPPQVRYRDLQVIDRADRVLLHLTAESTATSVTEAQRAFMTFHDALQASGFLQPLGEPRQLMIAEQEQDGSARKAVFFSLDYELLATVPAEEG